MAYTEHIERSLVGVVQVGGERGVDVVLPRGDHEVAVVEVGRGISANGVELVALLGERELVLTLGPGGPDIAHTGAEFAFPGRLAEDGLGGVELDVGLVLVEAPPVAGGGGVTGRLDRIETLGLRRDGEVAHGELDAFVFERGEGAVDVVGPIAGQNAIGHEVVDFSEDGFGGGGVVSGPVLIVEHGLVGEDHFVVDVVVEESAQVRGLHFSSERLTVQFKEISLPGR